MIGTFGKIIKNRGYFTRIARFFGLPIEFCLILSSYSPDCTAFFEV